MNIEDQWHKKIEELEIEKKQLKQWKESVLELESTWDIQAVAKALGVHPGLAIHPEILPGIEKLKAENASRINAHNEIFDALQKSETENKNLLEEIDSLDRKYADTQKDKERADIEYRRLDAELDRCRKAGSLNKKR